MGTCRAPEVSGIGPSADQGKQAAGHVEYPPKTWCFPNGLAALDGVALVPVRSVFRRAIGALRGVGCH
ncbi:MAG: hypothetical protein A2W31_17385 [Planctomycetes bacterium RBG_16_64_10]|nr:MAG: hypothetical protein A2W31_17385 [Planctomycetes bacterium RBG_16_64_10]